MKAATKTPDIYRLPATVLFCLGLLDLLRGFMHTFNLTWSATNVAKLNLSVGGDQLYLLGVFGISNWLTGCIYLLISRKAKNLSPYVLGIIPAAYLLGLIGITSGGVHAQADFEGKYFMLLYFAVCIVTLIIFLVQQQRLKAK